MTIFRSKAYVRVALGLTLSCLPAAAQSTYIYTGSSFTDYGGDFSNTSHISATMQVTNPLPRNQTCFDPSTLPGFTLSMTDGLHGTATWPQYLTYLRVSTDASGAIVAPWFVELGYRDIFTSYRTVETYNLPTSGCVNLPLGPYDFSSSDFGPGGSGWAFQAGTWSSPSPTIMVTMLITQFQLGILPDIGQSFVSQLTQVNTDIDTHNGRACQDLQTFVSHVKAQAGKKLSASQADSILQTVSQIASQLNCPS